MSAKISIEVTSLGKSCRFLLSALVRQGPQVDTDLTVQTEPYLQDGDGKPAFLDSIVANGRRLEASMNHLVEDDEKVYDANTRLTKLRKQRDVLTSSLAKAIVRMRYTALGEYQDPNFEALGLQSPKVWQPDPLLRQFKVIEKAFARDDLEQLLGLPASEATDPRRTLAPARRFAGNLRQVLVDLDDAQRQLDEAIIAKDRVKEEHGVLFTYTARAFEAFCILAGLHELAAKVRPSERRPGRTEQEVEEEEPLPSPDDAVADDAPGGDVEADSSETDSA